MLDLEEGIVAAIEVVEQREEEFPLRPCRKELKGLEGAVAAESLVVVSSHYIRDDQLERLLASLHEIGLGIY